MVHDLLNARLAFGKAGQASHKLLAVRAMVDVLATMVKHDRVGGRLKAA